MYRSLPTVTTDTVTCGLVELTPGCVFAGIGLLGEETGLGSGVIAGVMLIDDDAILLFDIDARPLHDVPAGIAVGERITVGSVQRHCPAEDGKQCGENDRRVLYRADPFGVTFSPSRAATLLMMNSTTGPMSPGASGR